MAGGGDHRNKLNNRMRAPPQVRLPLWSRNERQGQEIKLVCKRKQGKRLHCSENLKKLPRTVFLTHTRKAGFRQVGALRETQRLC